MALAASKNRVTLMRLTVTSKPFALLAGEEFFPSAGKTSDQGGRPATDHLLKLGENYHV